MNGEELRANVQQSKAAYRQARRKLAAYARYHWIGRRATVAKASWSVTATVVSVSRAGRIRLLSISGSFDIEEVQLV